MRERVYEYVRGRILAGDPPSIREICRELGFRSPDTARGHIEALVAEGRLVKSPRRRSRGLRLGGGEEAARGAIVRGIGVDEGMEMVPLLGRVPAGGVELAVEEYEGTVPARRRPGKRLFALEVHGDSMNGAGILDGDVVIVEQSPTAEDGEIVVALVEEEATVKRLRLRRGRAELVPENPRYRSIPVPGDSFRILGRVVEVHRYEVGAGGSGRKTRA